MCVCVCVCINMYIDRFPPQKKIVFTVNFIKKLTVYMIYLSSEHIIHSIEKLLLRTHH